jgi:hypothetical protein
VNVVVTVSSGHNRGMISPWRALYHNSGIGRNSERARQE